MMQRVDEILSQVTEETLSQLAFIFTEDMGDGDLSDAPLDTMAFVEFRGPFAGALTIETTNAILDEMTANMLGAGPGEATDDEKMDALKEILNVICGNLLPRIGGDTAVFDIGAPKINPETSPSGNEVGTARLILEGGICRVRLFAGEAPPEIG